MREDAQKEIAFAVQDRIFKPAATFCVVREESVGQCLPQCSNCNWIQFPQLRAPRETIRRGAAHSLARFLTSGERRYDPFEWLPNRIPLASIGLNAVDRELVRPDLAAPFDQPPTLGGREIGGS